MESVYEKATKGANHCHGRRETTDGMIVSLRGKRANAPSWLVAREEVELLVSEAGGVDCGLLYCLRCCLFFGITRRIG